MCFKVILFFLKKQKTIFFTESMLFFLFLYHFSSVIYTFTLIITAVSGGNQLTCTYYLLPLSPFTGWPSCTGLSWILVPGGAIGSILMVPGQLTIPRLRRGRKDVFILFPDWNASCVQYVLKIYFLSKEMRNVL